MDRSCDCVRSRGQNRARFEGLPCRIVPTLPQSGERKELTSVDLKAKRLLRLADLLPLVETIRRNQTSTEFQRIRERGLDSGGFASCIYHRRGLGRVLRP